VDSSSNGYAYAYAPSIIYEGGVYYMFYCSGPKTGGVAGPDVIRLASSRDRLNWGSIEVVLTPTSSSSNETHRV
jgi:hypothetical protein